MKRKTQKQNRKESCPPPSKASFSSRRKKNTKFYPETFELAQTVYSICKEKWSVIEKLRKRWKVNAYFWDFFLIFVWDFWGFLVIKLQMTWKKIPLVFIFSADRLNYITFPNSLNVTGQIKLRKQQLRHIQAISVSYFNYQTENS